MIDRSAPIRGRRLSPVRSRGIAAQYGSARRYGPDSGGRGRPFCRHLRGTGWACIQVQWVSPARWGI